MAFERSQARGSGVTLRVGCVGCSVNVAEVSDAVGQILAFGLAVGLSPIPIIGAILMLATPRARSNSLAFVAGWVLGLAAIGTLVLVVAGGGDASEQGAPAEWVSIVKLGLGVVLFWLAVRQWRGGRRKVSRPSFRPG